MEVSKEYHGVKRKPGRWYIEPDESIEPPDDYGAAEIISPTMTAPKALSQLPDFLAWCDRIGAEGHETTGFHINIGPPSQNTEDIDPVKLILFLGENYLLTRFGRLLSRHGQTYAKSTINKMREMLTTDIEKKKFDPQRVINSLKRFAVPAAAAMLGKFSEMPGRKYSINIKDEYVEFRAAGGDWMSNRQELINSVNRCLYVMAIAADPYAEQREYAIKLYKLLQNAMNLDQDQEELDETLKRVKGKWALVSRKNPKKVLQYYHGSGHPSKEWVSKVERRVHSFSEDILDEELLDEERELKFGKSVYIYDLFPNGKIKLTKHTDDRKNRPFHEYVEDITIRRMLRAAAERHYAWIEKQDLGAFGIIDDKTGFTLIVRKTLNIDDSFLYIVPTHMIGLRLGPLQGRIKVDADLEEAIDWQDVKRKAAGAALAGGLVGAAAMGLGNKAPSVPTQPAAVTQPAATQAPSVAAPAEPEKAAAMNPSRGENPRFPAELRDIHKADSKTRVDTFTKVMLPAIDAQNAHIKAQRAALLQLAKAKRYTPEQQQWLNDMMAQYRADDLQDLLKRVDIIPRSMALAQAAIESGWGTDPKTQKANVFYGQKTWSKTDGVEGPYGERYAGFESPEAAVKAYMKNLNTHDAYEKFRDQRAQLRRTGKDISGKHLIHSLDKYSTLGKKYTNNVNSIIVSKGLDKLD
jgi:uncharacterized FlgJ-related protein